MLLQFFISALVTLLVVVDPVGLVPAFVAITHGLPPHARRSVALRACLIAVAIRQARNATLRRACGGRPCVMATKAGTRPTGSTTTSRVTSADMKNCSNMAWRGRYSFAGPKACENAARSLLAPGPPQTPVGRYNVLKNRQKIPCKRQPFG